MRLKKQIVIAIVFLTAVSLVGLIALQTYLLKYAVEQKEQAFRQNVNAALNAIGSNLETREALSEVINLTVDVDEKRISKNINESDFEGSFSRDSIRVQRVMKKWEPDLKIDSNKVVFFLPNSQHVRIRILDSLGQVVENLVDGKKSAGTHQIDFEKSSLLKGVFHVNFVSDSTMYLMRVARGKTHGKLELPEENEERRLIVDRVLQGLTKRDNTPLEERVDPAQLDSLVVSALEEHGIDTPFAYGILTSSRTDSVLMSSRPELDNEIRNSEFKSRLFPNEVLAKPRHLAIYFPEQTFYLFKQSALLIVASVAFVLILVFSVAYLFRVLFKQKQFAIRLTSFINNMTHEFKTPLSTISLASETLGNPAIVQDREKFARYRRIIRDENARMRQQVEQILQMAVLEEGDFELKKTAIDANEIINNVVQNIGPRVDQRTGTITCKLDASPATIQADSTHLSNVIHNLLDNALKYTRTEPDLRVETANWDGGILVRVRDNGIGIGPEEQKHVFDKYYRVPTGNVHDVKGFGLGLSYVKLIVEAHNGQVSVKSVPGRGSTFSVFLPHSSERN